MEMLLGSEVSQGNKRKQTERASMKSTFFSFESNLKSFIRPPECAQGGGRVGGLLEQFISACPSPASPPPPRGGGRIPEGFGAHIGGEGGPGVEGTARQGDGHRLGFRR